MQLKRDTKDNLNQLISIVVPTQNDSDNLLKLFKSIINQTYTNWRLILVEGKSNSKNKRVTKNLAKSENRIIIVEQNFEKFKGIYGAMNQGIYTCLKKDFKWIMFLGSDDLLSSKNTLKNINKNLNKYNKEKFDLLIGSANYLNSKKKFIRSNIFCHKDEFFNSKEFRLKLFLGYSPCHQASIFKSSLFKDFLLYDPSFYLAADLDYFLRISYSNALKIYCINRNLADISYTGVSSKLHVRRILEVLKCYLKNFNVLFFAPFLFRYIRRILSLMR